MALKTRRNPELLVESAHTHQLFTGYLAEDYDGISQFTSVTLTRGSISSAFLVRVAAGDFNMHRPFQAGTPVILFADHGQIEILSLGGGGGIFAPSRVGTIGGGGVNGGLPDLPQDVYDAGGIASDAVVGTPRILRYIQPSSIAGVEAFGSPILLQVQIISPTGIVSGESFGAVIVIANQVIAPSGIVSSEVIGSHTLKSNGFILPGGIASAEALGTPTITTLDAFEPTAFDGGSFD